jgi:uridine kinase
VTEGDDIAEIVLGRFAHVPAHRPLRVGIDGRSAAGKTTFADQLAEAAGRRDRSVVRASVDDFHPPGHKSRGYTLETYYGSAFDYRRFRSWVLDPLEPGGGRRCRLAYWDSFTDTPASPELTSVAEEAVLIVDGALLLRPELRECWDVVVWLHISFDEMVARAVKRDVAWAGDPNLCVTGTRTVGPRCTNSTSGGRAVRTAPTLSSTTPYLGGLECCAPLNG